MIDNEKIDILTPPSKKKKKIARELKSTQINTMISK